MERVVKIYYWFGPDDKKRIRKWMIDNDTTYTDLAKKFDMSLSYIVAIIDGRRSIPDIVHAWYNSEVWKII